MIQSILLLALTAMLPFASQDPESQPPPVRDEPTGDPRSSNQPVSPIEDELDLEGAIRAAGDALGRIESRRKDPQDSQAEAQLKETLAEINDYIRVVEERDPTNPFLLYLNGRTLAISGRRGDAVDKLRKFVETREGRNEWRAHRILGDLFTDAYPRLGKASYQKAKALKAHEPTVLIGLSTCALKLGDYDEAVTLAREAVSVDGGNNMEYVSRVASILLAADRLDEALGEAESALRIAERRMNEDPGKLLLVRDVDAQYELLVNILKARILKPDHEDPKDYVRVAKYAQQRSHVTHLLTLHNVLGVLQAGVEKMSPSESPALMEEYGVTLAALGRTEDAIIVFEGILAADPNHRAASEWLGRLRADSPAANP